ncbi:hypothetical protein FOZ60_015146 [Perkinsus olseni]|uniref:Uncharacterized protein n=1 Tax=Perkinsus olseni TaxID=32597 RepID=A0A7J6N7C4_PEROL|nr:hypothetical protein FOZ60_015146 [Perkinsus olseni]
MSVIRNDFRDGKILLFVKNLGSKPISFLFIYYMASRFDQLAPTQRRTEEPGTHQFIAYKLAVDADIDTYGTKNPVASSNKKQLLPTTSSVNTQSEYKKPKFQVSQLPSTST